MKNKKEILRLKRHKRIKLRMQGDAKRPRLVIHRSLKNMNVLFVDDTGSKTLFSLSTHDKELKTKFTSGGNIKAAELFGQICAECAKAKGVTKVIFDRAGYLYHGRVKAFADALRKGGLEF